ncbi:hypothetical protein [Agrobacterium tumefaciens]|uniref:hypothetical protein n=1 Tax=Agrobacterium tumefaciens TaxID=358 RepID=UPI00045ADC21|nr:hypothetical protein [Agrobacterium tumefaciens]CDN93684.1 hypothetical protein BN949_02839 [Agrobacterium tumefaciens]
MNATVHLVEGPVTAASLLQQISDAGFQQDDATLRLLDALPADPAALDRFMRLRQDMAVTRSIFIAEASARLKGA